MLCMALQRIVRQINPREFPPEENSNKTELTCLNCVHYFMHIGYSELVQSTPHFEDLNEDNE